MKISSLVGISAVIVALGSPVAANALTVNIDLTVGNILGANVAATALPVLVPVKVPPINLSIPPKSLAVAGTSTGSGSSNAIGMGTTAQMGASSSVVGTRDFGQAIASGF